MSENNVHSAVKKLLPKANFQRIESWTGGGIFDSNWQLDGKDLWIEYKKGKKKKSHPNCKYKIEWRKGQIPWAAARVYNGAENLFVAYMIGKELIFIRITKDNLKFISDEVPYTLLKKLDQKTRESLDNEKQSI